MIINSAAARFKPTVDLRVAAVVTLTAAAAGLQTLWLATWRGGWTADYRLLALLIVLGATAAHFPVELTPKFKTNTATAVYFAMLLLYPPPIAVAAVGVSVLAGNGTLSLRRNALGQRRRGL